ncbi:hypothetical protein K0040_13840 [Terrisporobacter petrolearius]|uniref:hypothetical protein n=1 Tax=Terrisporobacter petrolearius TaxID=1460447 RepID=UPI001D1682E9|nr:hypothetical protein [Terrisporobacter petrolearius]MCC3865350.1 hypothetical protein [Terrisporobacter petrolearius]
MTKWEKIIAIASLVVGIIGIMATCISIAQVAVGEDKVVEPTKQIIILGDVNIAKK